MHCDRQQRKPSYIHKYYIEPGLGSNTYFAFVFEYRNLVYLYIAKRHVFENAIKYIYKLPTKGKALPDINSLRSQDRLSFTPGQEWAGSTEKIGLQ